MAELVGLIASIITLAETGFQIARAVSRIADEFGQAKTRIKSIATDTRTISFILRELQKRLERMRAEQDVIKETYVLTTEIITLCKTDIEGIEDLLKGLESKSKSYVSVKEKTKWLFTKSKISLRQSSLDSLKLTLSLLMHTLDFMECSKIE